LDKDLKAARAEYEKDYNPKPSADADNVGVGARAGVELVGAIIGGALLGYGIDHFFETSPIFFLIFTVLGIITGFYNIYKITMNFGTSVGFKGLKTPSKDAKQSQNLYDDDDDY
jgi:ATP synthase protein I